MPASDAQKRATKKWDDAHREDYWRCTIAIPIGEKQSVLDKAAARGMSISEYIRFLIDQDEGKELEGIECVSGHGNLFMLGATVRHNVWGEGTIVAQADSVITVSFSFGDKKFVFPDAFECFLTTDDEALLEKIAEIKAIKEIKGQEADVPDVKTEPAKVGPKKKKCPRPVERSNVAFKCNFCDGGSSAACIGYKRVCSDAILRYNIETAKHVWCNSDSPCKKYLNGEISRADLENQFVCYESEMLTEWKACAGVVQNGLDKGKPMKLLKVQNNSLCVLTTRLPDMAEDTRFVFAVFLVDESYEGDGRETGYVTNHSKWRIELTPEEAKQMLFWNYYWNKNAPDKIVFGSGLHRYLDDIQAAQILCDIVAVKKDQEEKELAQEFLHHFCTVVGLDEDEIPQNAGALKLN